MRTWKYPRGGQDPNSRRTHAQLKNINLSCRARNVVITGLRARKSSLAFDTLYARATAATSVALGYARQFLELMEKPTST